MNRTIRLIVYCLFLTACLQAQSELDYKLKIYGGIEYNIFKSPDELIDSNTNNLISKDSLIYTDMFFDVEYDIGYLKKINRSIIELTSNLWYRNYLEFTDFNQGRFSNSATYRYSITDALSMAGKYEFQWADLIGTSVTGDLKMRAVNYFGHSSEFFLYYKPSDTLDMNLALDYEYRNYYNEWTRDPLDQLNLELKYEMNYKISYHHDFCFKISITKNIIKK